ncbi:MAG: hypothetical protein J6Y08_06665 [Clostridiales bacterium]|nr:hypothetical protein [Clostridiales bacterium]
MATCKYCGQETGGSMFCQNCGAKVEAAVEAAQSPFQQSSIPNSSMNSIPTAPQQSYSFPSQPAYYTPGGAGGLLAGNIIAIIVGVVCCCCTYFISIVTLVLGIIGVVYASKVKSSSSPEEEAKNRRVSRIMMIIAYVALLIGLVVMVAAGLASGNGIEGFKESFMSAYESASISMEEATK